MDELAVELGMDPFEFRRRNMYVEGDYTITGQHLPSSVGAVATLEACRPRSRRSGRSTQAMARPGYRIGYGVAGGMKNVGAGKGKIDDAGATLTLKPDGRVELIASVVDMGQAIRTTMVQLAAQSTGLSFGRFDIVTQDTAIVHSHRSASGQRQTLVSGNAVVIAGKAFKRRLFELVAGWSGRAPEELAIVDDEFRTQWTQYVVEQPRHDPGRGLRARDRRGHRRPRGGGVHRAPDLAAVGPGGPPDGPEGPVPQLPDVRLRHPGRDRRGRRGDRPGRPAAGHRRP